MIRQTRSNEAFQQSMELLTKCYDEMDKHDFCKSSFEIVKREGHYQYIETTITTRKHFRKSP